VERYRQVADLPEPRIQTIALHPLLQNVERLIRPALTARGIALQSTLTPADLTVRADADLLEQTLINLLRNAADASADAHEARVEINCRIEDDRNVIEIRDNGPGLTPAQREQIFVPFFTTKPNGSGIGLSLARRITQAHGGLITVQANSPRGSILRITLPV
jgi:signal transduction histidine kinase